MRIRHKPWAVPELLASGFYVEKPELNKNVWREQFENQNASLYLELGCGKGMFIAKSAKLNPENNYIAVDIKSEMLGLAKRNIEREFESEFPKNVLLTSYNIERISEILGENDKVDRIYINFCNPWPKAKHNKHRLTHTKQLLNYKIFMDKAAQIRFKTDDDGLFLSSKRYFNEAGFEIKYITYDLHAENFEDNIITEHEKMFSDDGIKIKFLIAEMKK